MAYREDRGAPTMASPWHQGELALQARAGVVEKMAPVGRRNIRDHLIEQHRAFFPQLPFIVAGAVDRDGDAWATMLTGRPGFVQAPDSKTLHISARRNPADPADDGLDEGAAIGLLGIQLETRRRNRANGAIRRRDSEGFDVAIDQSYGNCPQYIRLRDHRFVSDPSDPPPQDVRVLDGLDGRARSMIEAAETFFIASYVTREARQDVDVSHRGGRPGFIRIGEDGTLTVPDFAGNLFFNTLGNIVTNPRCGLLFVDFATGDVLQLTGDGEVVLEGPEIAGFDGAERLLRFTPRRIVFRAEALPLRWRAREDGASPNVALTGTWREADSRLKAAQLAASWRPFRVARIVKESASVRSLYLKPTDGAGLIASKAGQHLPIRIRPNGQRDLVRTYTLSSGPTDDAYRISVKRDGLISNLLHTMRVGDVIDARAPAGSFTIDARTTRPAVLLGAGIGITPLLAMLRHIVREGLRTRRTRPTTLFFAARSTADRAFDAEIAALAEASGDAVRVVRALSDTTADPSDFETSRIDIDLLRATLPFDDYDFYVCGPAPFMQAMYDGLRGLNVADDRIHAETFGPSSLVRSGPATVPMPKLPPAATTRVAVAFTGSDARAEWTPDCGSLLDLAESAGLNPPFSCRVGSCGTCRSKITKGAVTYPVAPTAEAGPGQALICCAIPAATSDGGLEIEI